MSVRVNPWIPTRSKGSYDGPAKWRVTIRFVKTNGEKVRDIKIHEAPSKRMAQKWGEAREAQLRDGSLALKNEEPTTAPTWDEWWPKYIEACAAGSARRGKKEKVSSLESKKGTNKMWLSPHFGLLPLDQISDVKIGALRGLLAKAPGRAKGSTMSEKRVNNIMTIVLSSLKLALKWKVISVMPCQIEIPSIDDARPAYFDFQDFERLQEGASKIGTYTLVLVLLGAAAGLRRGEMMALRWDHVDFARRQILIDQSAWRRSAKLVRREGGPQIVITKPKGGKSRTVDMSDALIAALKAHRHLRSDLVLSLDDGPMAPGHYLKDVLEAAEKRAGLPIRGALHRLRHTFCTHLAMRGASQRAIQALAGHASGSTTQRYMWASPASTAAAIALLNEPPPKWALASND